MLIMAGDMHLEGIKPLVMLGFTDHYLSLFKHGITTVSVETTQYKSIGVSMGRLG